MSFTNSVILVKPTYLGCTRSGKKPPSQVSQTIFDNFNSLISELKKKKINILIYESSQYTPVATYPNNWISVHWETQKPTLVIYPMKSQTRRLERKSKILTDIISYMGPLDIIDLTHYEKSKMFLESTGPLVLDRQNKIAYCCLSDRVHPEIARIWARKLQYQIVIFNGYTPKGVPVYHTNVMMMIGNHFSVICLSCIKDPSEKQMVIDSLTLTGKQIIEINFDQFNALCANCLQVRNQDDKIVLCLSKSAYDHFTKDQIKDLSRYNSGGFAIADYQTIELIGKGSVRCAMLESFPIV